MDRTGRRRAAMEPEMAARQLKAYLAQQMRENKWFKTMRPGERISKALVDIGCLQARERGKGRGWICGTYTRQIRQCLTQGINSMYDEAQLEALSAYCVRSEEGQDAQEGDDAYESMLMALAKQTPYVRLNG